MSTLSNTIEGSAIGATLGNAIAILTGGSQEQMTAIGTLVGAGIGLASGLAEDEECGETAFN